MFKILNELVETPINDRLIPADRRTRGGHNQAYKHLRANTTLGQNSFWHRTDLEKKQNSHKIKEISQTICQDFEKTQKYSAQFTKRNETGILAVYRKYYRLFGRR